VSVPATRRKQSPTPVAVYSRLRRWFGHNARTLPWRGDTDPYRIWVSEVMLVQTTVAVAVRRYPRFLRRFPTLAALAAAPLSQVMKEWEGLGYYHRARFLHQAARLMRDRHNGRFPSDYDLLRALPGVGDYVAASVSNFCFGARIPAIDANVARVGARLLGLRGDVRSGSLRRKLREELAKLMNLGRGSLWTDGLIEIGALVCTPRQPQCPSCPLKGDCVAYASDRVESYGLPVRRPSRRVVSVACGIVRRSDGRILIAQRPATGLLPGLWEFPGGKRDGNESLADTCRREIKEELGVTVAVDCRRFLIRHAYSHYAVRLSVFECRIRSGAPRALGCQQFRWVTPGTLTRYSFPSANRKIVASIAVEENGRRRQRNISSAGTTRTRLGLHGSRSERYRLSSSRNARIETAGG